MPQSTSFAAVMKAHVKNVFAGIKNTVIVNIDSTETTALIGEDTTILLTGIEPVKPLPAKSALKKKGFYTTAAAAVKKVNWADHANSDCTKAPYNFGNGLNTTYNVTRAPEMHYKSKARRAQEKRNRTDRTYRAPCAGRCQSWSDRNSDNRDIDIGNEKWGLGCIGCFGWSKKSKTGFELMGVRKVPKKEGNGAVFSTSCYDGYDVEEVAMVDSRLVWRNKEKRMKIPAFFL